MGKYRIRTSGVPGGHPILDTTAEEEESDATKKGQDNSTEENRIEEGLDRRENEGRLFSGSDRWHQEKHRNHVT